MKRYSIPYGTHLVGVRVHPVNRRDIEKIAKSMGLTMRDYVLWLIEKHINSIDYEKILYP